MVHFKIVPYNKDNYGFIITMENNALIVDPGSSREFLKELKGFNLKFILLTHRHWDHIDGLKEVRSHYPDIKILDYKSESSEYMGLKLEILKTPRRKLK